MATYFFISLLGFFFLQGGNMDDLLGGGNTGTGYGGGTGSGTGSGSSYGAPSSRYALSSSVQIWHNL